MKELIKIEKYAKQIHAQYMKKKRTSDDHFICDAMFSFNLMQLALDNLNRWAGTTTTPKRAFKMAIKDCVKKHEQR